jgi:vancomycin resistance protein YoaR
MQINRHSLTDNKIWNGTLTQKVAIALTAFCLTFGVILLGISIIVHILYDQRIIPGVTAGGVALGGKTLAEAETLLQQAVNYPEQGRIVLKAYDQSWVVKPADLGMQFNYQQTALVAFETGRGRSIFHWLFDPLMALVAGYPVSPMMIYDERTAEVYLRNLANQIDTPTIETSLRINGTTVELTAGKVGRSLNIPATLSELNDGLETMRDFSLSLQVIETPPIIMDAREQAAIIQRVLFSPLTLSMPDDQRDIGPWVIPVEKLAQMLVIERREDSHQSGYQVTIDQTMLRDFLNGLGSSIEREVENARFIFNDDTRLLDLNQPSVIGRHLDIETSLNTITEELLAGEHAITLIVLIDQPAVLDDATADLLDIHELIWAETSYFYGSSPERIQNISAAAARFHGLLVPPGATFSMADALGDISLDNGYAEALIIFGDQTITGIGGGVCQVSTTLFRTAFHAGYPILERHAHAYRVSYYEQKPSGGNDPNLAGLDATVYVPLVDFKFTNDTQSWLLMETYVHSSSITWKFYSTSDGRSVDWQTSGPENLVEAPEPLYRENPDLEEGEINQIDWEAEGADVVVTRNVYREGILLFQDTFRTHYLPWQAIFEYGPGTKGIPEPES